MRAEGQERELVLTGGMHRVGISLASVREALSPAAEACP
jgi:hypothetical protein